MVATHITKKDQHIAHHTNRHVTAYTALKFNQQIHINTAFATAYLPYNIIFSLPQIICYKLYMKQKSLKHL